MDRQVNLNTAQLLNKKGFVKPTNYLYLTPTINQVVMWLYVKHGVWISINPTHTDELWGYEILVFCNEPYKGWFNEIKNYTFNSPTEAHEAAIEYTLINLI